jgi:murein DD-endopeptidase MepM/ murein hydrolase activator NlpD
VSRAKRADVQANPLIRPGQTVPGVWVRPNVGGMSSCFCERWGTLHAGIDLTGPLGSPILAVGDGVVIKAGPADGFGNWIVIQHSNGDVSIYGHMRYLDVAAGQRVKAGQTIALVGNEGQSTGPHLHFEVHPGGLEGTAVDPVPWLRARGITIAIDPRG